MSDDEPQFDEPDFTKHVANVLEDYKDGLCDTLDEAVVAIVEHPAVRRLLTMKVVGPLDP